MDILEMVRNRTGGRVNIGSATLYDLLEMFVTEGMIQETKVEGRRRSYMLTPKGKDMLWKEYDRIMMQAQDFRNVFGEEVSQ